MSTVIVLLVVVLGIWLALEAVGLLFRLGLWALVIAGLYWLAAPYLGLPMPWR